MATSAWSVAVSGARIRTHSCAAGRASLLQGSQSGVAVYSGRVLELSNLGLEELANALADQTDYEQRWLINPQTGEIAFWTADTGIDGPLTHPASRHPPQGPAQPAASPAERYLGSPAGRPCTLQSYTPPNPPGSAPPAPLALRLVISSRADCPISGRTRPRHGRVRSGASRSVLYDESSAGQAPACGSGRDPQFG